MDGDSAAPRSAWPSDGFCEGLICLSFGYLTVRAATSLAARDLKVAVALASVNPLLVRWITLPEEMPQQIYLFEQAIPQRTVR
jgi:hypothetical protein